MKRLFKNRQADSNAELQKAIDECSKVAEHSAKEAKEIVKFIKESINQANKEVETCITEISKQKIRDDSTVQNLKKQLAHIKVAFTNEYNEVEAQVEKKAKAVGEFNITLFGRTKVGKSTLMEILTEGDGSSIGKGGQRTTLDVRKYKWKGLTITDVPGIDAFNGTTDDRLALEAAKSADVVLFMISDGQPEKTEAEWLVRLKRLDKPIICLCNAKQSLDDELDMEMFLDEADEILTDERIRQILDQFNQFVKDELPQEHIDILVTQLQARYLANKKEYAAKRLELLKASRFGFVEKSITDMVIRNGISFRRKCYLSIVDSPLYSQALVLLQTSSDAYNHYLLAHSKMLEFVEWEKSFVSEERQAMLNRVEAVYGNLMNSIPAFVEENLEKDNFGELWDEKVKRFGLERKVKQCLTVSVEKAKKKVDQLFKALETESQLQDKLIDGIKTDAKGARIVNAKRAWGWAGAVAGVAGAATELGLTIASALGVAAAGAAIPVVGWVVLGATLLCGLFALFCDSREDKRRKARIEREKALKKAMSDAERKTQAVLRKAYADSLTADTGLLSDTFNRFHVIESTLLSLTNSQRQLGLEYLKRHTQISKRIIQAALYDAGVEPTVLDRIDFVARVPGKKTLIGYCSDVSINPAILSQKIGNKEDVRFYKYPLSGSLEANLERLKGYFHLRHLHTKLRIIKTPFEQNVVYIPQSLALSDEEETNLLLLQQILNIHIIKR